MEISTGSTGIFKTDSSKALVFKSINKMMAVFSFKKGGMIQMSVNMSKMHNR
jgi:hypothetical protein